MLPGVQILEAQVLNELIVTFFDAWARHELGSSQAFIIVGIVKPLVTKVLFEALKHNRILVSFSIVTELVLVLYNRYDFPLVKDETYINNCEIVTLLLIVLNNMNISEVS